MKIQINEKYRIATDERSWMIQKRRKPNKQGIEWKTIRFYQSLEATLKGLAELELRLSEATNLLEAQTEWQRITAEIQTALYTPPIKVPEASTRPPEDQISRR